MNWSSSLLAGVLVAVFFTGCTSHERDVATAPGQTDAEVRNKTTPQPASNVNRDPSTHVELQTTVSTPGEISDSPSTTSVADPDTTAPSRTVVQDVTSASETVRAEPVDIADLSRERKQMLNPVSQEPEYQTVTIMHSLSEVRASLDPLVVTPPVSTAKVEFTIQDAAGRKTAPGQFNASKNYFSAKLGNSVQLPATVTTLFTFQDGTTNTTTVNITDVTPVRD
jgi:hypothetical protein